MEKKYIVTLTEEERKYLLNLIKAGKNGAQKLCRARILLKADINGEERVWKDKEISEALLVNASTVENVRQRFVEEGLEIALNGRNKENHRMPKIDGEKEAHLIALACSEAPEGKARWTVRLLADRMVELNIIDSVCHETVRKTLKKTNLNLTKEGCGVSRQRKMQSS
jgi:transposase